MHMLRKKYRIQLKIQNVINLTWTTRESLYSVNCWSSKNILGRKNVLHVNNSIVESSLYTITWLKCIQHDCY